jgi:hypothetical protein
LTDDPRAALAALTSYKTELKLSGLTLLSNGVGASGWLTFSVTAQVGAPTSTWAYTSGLAAYQGSVDGVPRRWFVKWNPDLLFTSLKAGQHLALGATPATASEVDDSAGRPITTAAAPCLTNIVGSIEKDASGASAGTPGQTVRIENAAGGVCSARASLRPTALRCTTPRTKKAWTTRSSRTFAQSCNNAFSGYYQKVTTTQVAQTAAKYYGFNEPWDVGLSQPTSYGEVPDAASDSVAEELVGQDRITTSPLAMASVAATVDTGTFKQPILIPGTKQVAATPLPSATGKDLHILMRAVVTQGTLAGVIEDTDAYAKTGTAEVGTDNNSWTIAFKATSDMRARGRRGLRRRCSRSGGELRAQRGRTLTPPAPQPLLQRQRGPLDDEPAGRRERQRQQDRQQDVQPDTMLVPPGRHDELLDWIGIDIYAIRNVVAAPDRLERQHDSEPEAGVHDDRRADGGGQIEPAGNRHRHQREHAVRPGQRNP